MKPYAAPLCAVLGLSAVLGYATPARGEGAYGAPDTGRAASSAELPSQESARVAPEGAASVAGVAWVALTPAEQRLLRRFAGEWATLPPQRQASLVRGAQRWLAATPEERRRWREFFHRWRALSPAERERLRERWEALSPEERERLQDLLRFGHPPGRHHGPGGHHRHREQARPGEHGRVLPFADG